MKKKLRTSNKIGPFVDDKGVVIDKPVTTQLSEQYADMWSNPLEDKKIDPSNFFDTDDNTLSDKPKISKVFFTRDKVIKAIDMLDAEAVAGPDGVPASFIKKIKEILADPITELGNKSMEEGIFPSLFKASHVIPGKKPGKSKSKAASF